MPSSGTKSATSRINAIQIQRILDSYVSLGTNSSTQQDPTELPCPISRCYRTFPSPSQVLNHINTCHKTLSNCCLITPENSLPGCLGDGVVSQPTTANITTTHKAVAAADENQDGQSNESTAEQVEGVLPIQSQYNVNLENNLKISLEIDKKLDFNVKDLNSNSVELNQNKKSDDLDVNKKSSPPKYVMPEIKNEDSEKDLKVLKEINICPNEIDLSWAQLIKAKENFINDSENFSVKDFFVSLNDIENSYQNYLKHINPPFTNNSPKNFFCCICLENQSTTNNTMLRCNSCKINVHQECFGVTYIPQGSWLCHKCLISPDSNPKCVLCPNLGGVYKQTVDLKWCHVNCALWIPECGFSRPIYLDPIDFLEDIPESRYKFTCSVCNIKNDGACIQCYKSGCYNAFHVTCGLKEGFKLKIEIVSENKPGGKVSYSVKKEAFCKTHSNVLFGKYNPHSKLYKIYDLKNSKKLLENSTIANYCLSEEYKSMQCGISEKFLNFWKIKKFYLNGLILPTTISKNINETFSNNTSKQSTKTPSDQIKSILSLIIKRERSKLDLHKQIKSIFNDCFSPSLLMTQEIFEIFEFLDKELIFSQPVSLDIAPNYLQIIKKPMDVSKLKDNLKSKLYTSYTDLIQDIDLIFTNCLIYNPPKNYYHLYGNKLKKIMNIYILFYLKRLNEFVSKAMKLLNEKLENKEKANASKKRRRSSIVEIVNPKRTKRAETKPYNFYWCKVKGFNWFPAIVLEENVKQYKYFENIIPLPSEEVKLLKPKSGTFFLIAYMEKSFPMQWVEEKNMYEMFCDPNMDKIYLEGKYKNSYHRSILKKSFKIAERMFETIKNT